jgi:ribonuclease D
MRAQGSTREVQDFGQVRVFSGDIDTETYVELATSERIAWDIETNGLEPQVAEIGTCQLYASSVGAVVVAEVAGKKPPLLSHLLADAGLLKIFHHAPFDLSFMAYRWDVVPHNVGCTKIAVKILHPYAPAKEFSLAYLMRRYFDIELDKQMRFTDWINGGLSEVQMRYAVGDVIKLLDLYDLLTEQLEAKGMVSLYERCRAFLPTHVALRLRGCPDPFQY